MYPLRYLHCCFSSHIFAAPRYNHRHCIRVEIVETYGAKFVLSLHGVVRHSMNSDGCTNHGTTGSRRMLN
jgi:hypothetical protein